MKTIPGFEKYSATRDGKIYSHISKRFLKLYYVTDYRNTSEYSRACVGVSGKRMFVHRLVAMAYLPNPNNLPVINHKDSNPRNNNVDNLEWCTQKENIHHAMRAGRHNKDRKLFTDDEVRLMRSMYPTYTHSQIAKRFNSNNSTIGSVLQRVVYKYVE